MSLSRKHIYIIATAVIISAVCAFLATKFKEVRDVSLSKSCANHFSFFRGSLERLADENPNYILPVAPDTESAMEIITPDLKEHIRTLSLSCPEAYAKSKRIGYVYIGEGLKIGDAIKNSWPILFCPSTSHRGKSEHCHAWPVEDGGYCVKSNADMIGILESALKDAQAGRAPYSKNSISIMLNELKKRKAPGS